jgi:hypothetical protein
VLELPTTVLRSATIPLAMDGKWARVTQAGRDGRWQPALPRPA